MMEEASSSPWVTGDQGLKSPPLRSDKIRGIRETKATLGYKGLSKYYEGEKQFLIPDVSCRFTWKCAPLQKEKTRLNFRYLCSFVFTPKPEILGRT